MTLRLVIEHSPKPQARSELRVAGGDASIGRGAECDWQIEDAEMFVSRRHCVVSVRDGQYSVTDSSRGGLFVDGARTPLGTGNSVRIEHGTRLRLGDIVLRVEVEREALPAMPAGPSGRAAAESALGFDADDFFARRPDPAPLPQRPGTLPEPFDTGRAALAAPPPERKAAPPAFDDPFMMDPLGTPGALPAPAPSAGHVASATERNAAPEPRSGKSSTGRADFFSQPAQALQVPHSPPPAPMPAGGGDHAPPEHEFAQPERVVIRQPAAPVTPAHPMPSRFDEPPISTPQPSAPPAVPPSSPAAAADEAQLGAAFLRGLGLDPAAFSAATMTAAEFEALGRRFRLMADGLVQLLRARAKEKGSVRVAQTVIGSADVNPLKFLATTEDALGSLVAARGKGYLSPEDAITGAYRDLTDHQMRTWIAVQSALRGMVDRFDPETFEREADADGTLRAILSGGRGARLWQLYRTRYREIAKAAEERFLGEVGADFRDAYEANRRDE